MAKALAIQKPLEKSEQYFPEIDDKLLNIIQFKLN